MRTTRVLRYLAQGAFLLHLCFWHAQAASADEIALALQPIALNAEAPAQRKLGRLTYLAGYEISSPAPEFGGYSGLSIAADGRSLTAISDIGHWWTAVMFHDAEDRLIELARSELKPLRDSVGAVITSKLLGDAEALTRTADGSFLVAFEGRHRLSRYANLDAKAEVVESPRAARELPGNSGLEALAYLKTGELVAVSEGVPNLAGDTRAWVRRGAQWSEFSIAASDDYRPTDLAAMPNGDLLLIERRFKMVGSVRCRISIIAAADVAPAVRVTPQEVAILHSPMAVDNFEAIAVRTDQQGKPLIYILSDDNHNPLQRTLLMQFRLED